MQLRQAAQALNSRFSHLSGLQLFQLVRYATFVLAGIGFAKMHLPPSVIGHYETFILLAGMVTFFWVSGIINALLSAYPKLSRHEQQEIYFNTFIALLGLGLLTAGLLWCLADRLLLLLLDKKSSGSLITWVSVYLLLNSPSFLIEYLLYLEKKKEALLYYAGLFSFFTLAAILLPAAVGLPIYYSFVALIALAALKLTATLIVIARYGRFRLNPALLRMHLRLAWPLMLSIFVSGSAEYIDGMIIKARFDNVAFAVYRYGAKELPVLLIVANTLSTAMIAAIAANLEDGLHQIKRKAAQLMHIFFPLSVVFMLVSPQLFRYVFNDSFIFSAFIFNIYLLLIIPRMWFPQTVLTGLHHTRYLLLSSVLEIILNVTLSVWLAAQIGLAGVAAGTVVAYTADKFFLAGVLYFRYGISPTRYLPLVPYLLYSLALILAFAGSYWISARF